MEKVDFHSWPSFFVEVVHIELSNKWIHVTVFEIVWEDLLGEALLVKDLEANTVFAPSYDAPVLVSLQD